MRQIHRLPPAKKWNVVERYLRGEPCRDLCRTPGVDRMQIKRWLHRIKEHVGEIFEPRRKENFMRQIRQGSLGSADETFEALHEEISTLRSRCAFLQKAVDGKAKEHFAALQAQNASLKKVNAKLRLSYSELKLKHEPLDQGAARRRSERKTPDLLTLSAGGGI